MFVREVMTRDVTTCGVEDTLERVVQLMSSRSVGVLAVVRNDRCVGVVTDRDVAIAAYRHNTALRNLKAADAMSRDLFSCGPDDDLSACGAQMRERGVHRLPVIDDGSLVGIVSTTDIAHGLLPKADASSARELVETISAITRTRSAQIAATPA